MNQKFKDQLAASLGIGSEHSFRCRCEICRQWWIAMGPDNFEDADSPNYVPTYGPFTQAEIEGDPPLGKAE
jgi:hypothetical protein